MNPKDSHFSVAAVALAVLVLVPFAIMAAFRLKSEIWIVTLFAIPLAVQIRGVWLLYKKFRRKTASVFFSWFYLLTMSVCLVSYCALWGVYAFREELRVPVSDEALSRLALVVIALLLLLVIRMTRAIIEGKLLTTRNQVDHDEKLNKQNSFTGFIESLKRNMVNVWSLDQLKTGASDEPFLTLAFFFTVFLGVSYLFGFALAFHDRAQPPDDPALYMKNLNPFPQSSPSPTIGEGAQKPPSVPSPTPISGEFTFQFIEGLATMPVAGVAEPNYLAVSDNSETRKALEKKWKEALKSNGPLLPDDPKVFSGMAIKLRNQSWLSKYLQSRLTQDTKDLLKQYASSNPVSDKLGKALIDDLNKVIGGPSIYDKELFKGIHLSAQTSALSEQNPDGDDCVRFNRMLLADAYPDEIPKNKFDDLIERIANSTQRHERIRLVIVGYSDATQVRGRAYQSNYELAQARAENAKEVIQRSLNVSPNEKEWENIEWSCRSLSNELKGSEKMVRIRLEPALQDAGSLILKAEHSNQLSLLDYVYFANYTITTTGYGDIVPTTAYAKFVCSFANIVEVVFLVVFFNVLVSLRRNDKKGGRLTPTEIRQIATAVRKSLPDNIPQNNPTSGDVMRAEEAVKVLEQSESENRQRIETIEVSIGDKANKADIKAEVNEQVRALISNPLQIFRRSQ